VVRERLCRDAPWTRRWTAVWRFPDGEIVCAVRDLDSMPVEGSLPVRRFAWRKRQRHRPGLQFLVSTGRHHGFESLAEQRLLLALDFAGAVSEVLPQPFRLVFDSADGRGEHTRISWRCGQADRFFDSADFHDRQGGPEGFLGHTGHRVIDIDEHRGRVEAARLLGAPASRQRPRPGGDRRTDVAFGHR
jgi:hypothetical protein